MRTSVVLLLVSTASVANASTYVWDIFATFNDSTALSGNFTWDTTADIGSGAYTDWNIVTQQAGNIPAITFTPLNSMPVDPFCCSDELELEPISSSLFIRLDILSSGVDQPQLSPQSISGSSETYGDFTRTVNPDGIISLQAVPEPATGLLLCGGLAMLIQTRFRRRCAKCKFTI